LTDGIAAICSTSDDGTEQVSSGLIMEKSGALGRTGVTAWCMKLTTTLNERNRIILNANEPVISRKLRLLPTA